MSFRRELIEFEFNQARRGEKETLTALADLLPLQ